MAQDYTQVKGVDFDESFAPVARLESIQILLSVACIMNFKFYQMDVKSAFLNGLLQEVFVEQPMGFQDPHFPNHVLRLKKALYGLKQAPRHGMIILHNIFWIMVSKEVKSTEHFSSYKMRHLSL